MGLFRRKKHNPTDDPTIDSAASLDAFDHLVDREWGRLANAGTWWFAGERIAIAEDARRAARGERPSGILPAPIEAAVRRVATDPAGIQSSDVARWEHEGLDPFAYVEVVGIVSRLMAVDIASFGLGRDLRPLPDPLPGEPTRTRPEGAAITTGWAPTIGAASAPSSLSAVPPEADAMLDLHASLYAPMEEAGEPARERDGLTRAQIELVAARTSSLNGCVSCLLGHTSMLRESIASHGATLDPRPIVSGVGATGIDHGAEIIAFVDAVVLGDREEYGEARTVLEQCIGAGATARAAMIAGTFSMVNRALDAIGAPVDRHMESLATEMGMSIPSAPPPR